MEYDGELSWEEAELIHGSSARWRALLDAGQKRILENEFEDCLNSIFFRPNNRHKALCDLHQRITYMFLRYFEEQGEDTHALFHDQASYAEYMGSFKDPEALRSAFHYMMRQVNVRKTDLMLPRNDIEKAKNYFAENIAEPITVRDVEAHICLSAEYFTKLFKRETGQNLKEYITLCKVFIVIELHVKPFQLIAIYRHAAGKTSLIVCLAMMIPPFYVCRSEERSWFLIIAEKTHSSMLRICVFHAPKAKTE